MPMVSKRVSASASCSASTTLAGRTKLWVTRPRRHRGRPKSAPWICRCAWTTLARRPQLHRANNSKRWDTSDEEEERPSPYEPTPVVLRLGSTALDLQLHQALRGKSHHLTQQIGVGALLQQGARAHHLVGHRWILGSVEHVPTKPYRRFTMTTAVDKWPASARLMAVATADHLPTAPTPFSGTRPTPRF